LSEDGLGALLGLIENQRAARRTGGVLVGQREGLIHFLFGQPMHAEATPPGSATLVGLEAVRAIGGLAASGRPATWDAKAPMTADRSLETVSIGDVLHALRAGAEEPPVTAEPLPEPEPEAPPPPAPARPSAAAPTVKDARQDAAAAALVAPPVRPIQPELTLAIDQAAGGPGSPPSAVDRPADGSVPHPATGLLFRLPLPVGDAEFEDALLNSVRLETFIADTSHALLSYRSEHARGVAMLAKGAVITALFEERSIVKEGPDALAAIMSADDGTVTLSELPAEVFEALPTAWAGSVEMVQPMDETVDIDVIGQQIGDRSATASILVSTPDIGAVILFMSGKMVAAFSSVATHSLLNPAALASILARRGATVEVRATTALGLTDGPPPPASAEPVATSPLADAQSESEVSDAWPLAQAAMLRAIDNRLHAHGRHVRPIVENADGTTAGVRRAARDVGKFVIPGVAPSTMRLLATELESLGLARLGG